MGSDDRKEPERMKHARPRRVRAVLAVAAVLGLGTVATLALWTDSEFAVAPFGACLLYTSPSPRDS